MAEFALIERIRARCVDARDDVRLGIGDDGAILAPRAGCELVVSTDTLVASVHFPQETAAADIGWKALAVNLSDLAAMGAEPAWATLALTLPDDVPGFVDGFIDGFAALAARHGVALVGGDTTRGPLNIGVTVVGFVPEGQALRRDRAQVGDAVFVTGTLGDAAAGLQSLGLGPRDVPRLLALPPGTREALLDRLNRPTPRVAAGLALRGLARACIDVSDGLLADLGHIAVRSGVGIEVMVDALPTSAALGVALDVAARLPLQLAGGDDYELAFTLPRERIDALHAAFASVPCAVHEIGRVVVAPGVRVLDHEDHEVAVPRHGWEHFA